MSSYNVTLFRSFQIKRSVRKEKDIKRDEKVMLGVREESMFSH